MPSNWAQKVARTTVKAAASKAAETQKAVNAVKFFGAGLVNQVRTGKVDKNKAIADYQTAINKQANPAVKQAMQGILSQLRSIQSKAPTPTRGAARTAVSKLQFSKIPMATIKPPSPVTRPTAPAPSATKTKAAQEQQAKALKAIRFFGQGVINAIKSGKIDKAKAVADYTAAINKQTVPALKTAMQAELRKLQAAQPPAKPATPAKPAVDYPKALKAIRFFGQIAINRIKAGEVNKAETVAKYEAATNKQPDAKLKGAMQAELRKMKAAQPPATPQPAPTTEQPQPVTPEAPPVEQPVVSVEPATAVTETTVTETTDPAADDLVFDEVAPEPVISQEDIWSDVFATFEEPTTTDVVSVEPTIPAGPGPAASDVFEPTVADDIALPTTYGPTPSYEPTFDTFEPTTPELPTQAEVVEVEPEKKGGGALALVIALGTALLLGG